MVSRFSVIRKVFRKIRVAERTFSRYLLIAIFFIIQFEFHLVPTLQAQTLEQDKENIKQTNQNIQPETNQESASSQSEWFSLNYPQRPEKRRGYILSPLISAILPGFDQWYEGQYASASLYSGSAIVGMLILNSAADTMNLNSEVPEVEEDEMDISSRDNEIRQYFLGGQIYMAAGSFSAYHGFRSAVRAHKEEGKFKFLTHEEKVDDILRAPFEFDFLSRKTTYIPLLIASGFMVLSSSSYSQIFKGNSFNFSDAFYGSAYSYLAGTHEEAMYRGWLMPVFMESWDSPFWSNATTSALFAAAHISDDNPVPWPQLLMGWYLGWMTQRNQWSLKEAVFLHTWWDVVIITGSYFIEARQDKERAVLRLPVMTLSF